MFELVFAVLWTVVSTALIVAGFDGLSQWERSVAMLFPVFGLFAIVLSWRRLRRRRSLRVETEGDSTWYVWIEIDGRERRSTRDPREDWDSEGDGDGGDGGGD